MAASCMQLDSEYLVEAQRRSLCHLELPQLFFELRQRLHAQGSSSDDAHIDWLFVRLQQCPLHRVLVKRPAAVVLDAALDAAEDAAGDAAVDARGAQRGRAGGSA